MILNFEQGNLDLKFSNVRHSKSRMDFPGGSSSRGARHWESSDIRVRQDGNWMVFIDSRGKREINSPRIPITRNVSPRYFHKDYSDISNPEKPKEADVLVFWKKNNYNEFRPPQTIYGCSPQLERPADDEYRETGISCAPDNSTKYFRGSKKKMPFRISSKIINDYRIQHAKMIKRPNVPPKEKAKAKFTLFERSIKPPTYKRYHLPDSLVDYHSASNNNNNKMHL